jgi:hypothetical protein
VKHRVRRYVDTHIIDRHGKGASIDADKPVSRNGSRSKNWQGKTRSQDSSPSSATGASNKDDWPTACTSIGDRIHDRADIGRQRSGTPDCVCINSVYAKQQTTWPGIVPLNVIE